jgi:hypothetical protein
MLTFSVTLALVVAGLVAMLGAVAALLLIPERDERAAGISARGP